GRVLDDNGEPISGVSISIIGTDIVTATNAQGFFTLNSVQKDVTLKFIYIGYKTQELALNGKSELEIIMVPQHASLDEVVVIGYGAVAKSDLTGSVSSIKAEDLTKGVNVNVQQSLIGRSSGVQIYQKSGEPGAAMSVQIRGITS